MSHRDYILDPYPKAWRNPVDLRPVATALTGAWDAAPVEQNIAGSHGMTLSFTYTQGAAGGAFDWQIQTSIYSVAANVPAGASEWSTESLYQAGLVVTGADVGSDAQRQFVTYGSTGVGAESFVVVVEPVIPIERIRIRARESGVVGTPGTLQITAEIC